MKRIKILILIVVLPLLGFSAIHKYYISVTEVNFIEEKHSVQITSRIFIDDFENALRQRYDENIVLADKKEPVETHLYIEKYLKDKLKIKINGKDMNLVFIGKEYDVDIMMCYLEIENVKKITSIEITDQVLFETFDNQQNMIKTKIYSKLKSFLLNQNNKVAVLNFN
ncbi:DUF6702 family protein [Yeosuana sp.]|uniref:DUF6702 family protein n=1 Tax=Yeosuana sp. TaxID=2529388 RepID=UPI004054AF2E|tara:strand:+ start:4266 stop:4769 length:504 start_codon:yes stop_codon:yes gene_type:complete